MPFDKFIILSLLVLISHGLDHKKEQCNKGQRQRREIHTDDVQKVLEAQFLPDGLSPHLYDHFNNIVFETVGYSVAGAIYSIFRGEGQNNIAAFEAHLSPLGVLNNIVRWWRNMIFSFSGRAGLDLAALPQETASELLVNGGFNKYTETVFQEGFIAKFMVQWALDGLFGFMGWALFWIYTRLNKGQPVTFSRSLQQQEQEDFILNSLDSYSKV